MRTKFSLILLAALLAGSTIASAQALPRRRALLIGINDYTASKLGPRPRQMAEPDRDWADLTGTVNDVTAMQEMLVLVHGFDRAGILTLTDQGATRRAILQAIEQHLLKDARKGDVLLFYYSGHGSQVRNSRSDEPDRMDESIVPADSRIGARDIRDKELRPLFNRILERGARLTIVLDKCHSASGVRGLATGMRPRSVTPDLHDVADPTIEARPEQRGALVLAASQDFSKAWETVDDNGIKHGAFSWAWLRAMRDAPAGEPAVDTFLRAQARLRGETPFQEPVLEGNDEARFTPFLGGRTDRRADRTVVGVARVRDDGTVVLQGGWAHGLAVGSGLRVISDRNINSTLTVTSIQGLGRSEARMTGGRAMPQSIQPGSLLEVVGWAAPSVRPLRVWMPRVSGSVGALADVARKMAGEAAKRGLRWVPDPLDVTPTHLLRRGAAGWELLGPRSAVEQIGDDAAAVAAVARIPSGSSLFVQFPALAMMTEGIDVGAGTDREGIVPAARAEEADYILVGRWQERRLEYAWLRPAVTSSGRRRSALPFRTKWVAEDERDGTLRDSVASLRDAVLRLRRIHGWQQLESPSGGRFAYRLALRRKSNQDLVREPVVIGEEVYQLTLRTATPLGPKVASRYVYVFVIDSDGKSTLLLPEGGGGSVENRFPLSGSPAEIPLTEFEVSPPYGVDTYFLLTADEPLPNPWILEWSGVRAAPPAAPSALEQLLLLTGSSARAPGIATPANWSLEKAVFESVSPRGKSKKPR